MKKKQLELILQEVPQPEKPKPYLEQYITPASIASDILYIAHQYNDIQDKIVIDLGCGTGIFAIGAAIIGAQQVVAIDVDKDCISLAQTHSKNKNLEIEFKTQDITDIDIRCDTVIMNPPFGAQKSSQKADRKFIEKSFEIGDIVYSLHLSETITFIEKLISALGGDITYQKNYVFPIKWMFEFHKKRIKKFDVTLVRIKTTN